MDQRNTPTTSYKEVKIGENHLPCDQLFFG